MKKKNFLLIGMLFFLAANHIYAYEEKEPGVGYNLGEVIVTATKTEQYQAQAGSSSTVITARDIEKKGKTTIQEILRNIPGVSVMQNGPYGGSAALYLRGSEIGHTLVLVDGVEVRDPMQMYGGFFDFAHLSVDNIERIEVIRGPQSTLYGSDAIGGVINIITRGGQGKPKFEISSGGGSHNTFRESAGINGSAEKTDYSFSLSRMDSDGISKARDGVEKDSYLNSTLSSKIGYKLSDNSRLSLVTRFTDAQASLDDGAYDDDPNSTAWWKDFNGKISFSQAINSCWDHNLAFSYHNVLRKYLDEKDNIDTTEDIQSWYKAENKKIDWQHNFSLADWDILTGGFEYEEERGESYYRSRAAVTKFDRRKLDSQGYYLQNQFKFWEKLFITGGLRIDDYDLFGRENNYKLSGSYLVPLIETRLKANYGTGFKAPSLYQRYSDYGDPNLSPEKNRGYDFGIERGFFNNVFSLKAAYFYNDFENLIAYNSSTSKYENINKARTKGSELEFSFKAAEKLEIGANYTYTKARDRVTGRDLVKRPKNQAGFDINWSYSQKGSINLETSYVGHRWDDTANIRKIKPYFKVDIATYYNLTANIQIFGRIENLFDRVYEEARGYSCQDRSFYSGCKVKF